MTTTPSPTLSKKIYVSMDGRRCYLRARVDYDRLQFYYSKDGVEWNSIGPVMDYSILSDEHCMEECLQARLPVCAARIYPEGASMRILISLNILKESLRGKPNKNVRIKRF